MLTDRLVAHRGYQQLYPENTLLSVSKAIESGAHYIEVDVMFSADGKPVLYHDITMQRISGMDNAVHRLPIANLTQISASEPDRLGDKYHYETIAPLSILPPLLRQYPSVTLFVEVKRAGIHLVGRDGAFQEIMSALDSVRSQCVLISFDRDFILLARQNGWPSVGVVLEGWDDLELPIIKAIDTDYIFCSERHITNQNIFDIGNARLVIYEVDNADKAIEWFRRGADMVETFNIGGMLHELSHRAL